MTPTRHAATLLLALFTLSACSGAQPAPDPVPAPDEAEAEAGDVNADGAEEEPAAEEALLPDATAVSAAMAPGPYADFDAFAAATGATLLAIDPGEDGAQGEWVAQMYMIRDGAKVRQVMLAGKAGALYLMPSEDAFLVDMTSHTPDQYEGRAIVREASLPPGYVLFEHIVDFVDETQSGQAHDVLGLSHLCRPHDGGLACARFTTQKGAYLIYDGDDGDYEMPNAVIKDADGAEHAVELFYMNGGEGMDAPGFYTITLP
jgi:hypothetical protein